MEHSFHVILWMMRVQKSAKLAAGEPEMSMIIENGPSVITQN